MTDSSPEIHKSNISEVSNLHDEYKPLLSSSLNSNQNEKQPFLFHQFQNDPETTNLNNSRRFKKETIEKSYFKLLESNKIDKLKLKAKRKCLPLRQVPTNSFTRQTSHKQLIYNQIKQSKLVF